VLFTWQQRFESLALGFKSSRSPAKFAKRFESLNLDSRIRLTTTMAVKKLIRLTRRTRSEDHIMILALTVILVAIISSLRLNKEIFLLLDSLVRICPCLVVAANFILICEYMLWILEMIQLRLISPKCLSPSFLWRSCPSACVVYRVWNTRGREEKRHT
jgi:hypothetical protein